MIGTALAIGSTLFSGYQQYRGGEESERLADKEEQLEWELTKEELRRMDRERELRRGDMVAQTAASGVELGSGSPADVLQDFLDESFREREAVKKAGVSKASAIRSRGQSASRIGRAGATASGIEAINIIGEANDWWT